MYKCTYICIHTYFYCATYIGMITYYCINTGIYIPVFTQYVS